MARGRKDAKILIVRVINMEDKVVRFIMRDTTMFKKLIKVYVEKAGISLRTCFFKFQRKVICMTDTPRQLRIKNNDVVTVYRRHPA